MIENVIKSISFDQHEIIRNILTLHCGGGNIDLDMTFSKGGFYKNGVVRPKLAVELDQELAKKHGVICADCTALPIESASQRVVILDPPFGIGSGASLNRIVKGRNITPGRFSCFPNHDALFGFVSKAIGEAYRVLAHKGILILKIMPVVACAKQHMTHIHAANVAREIGFYFLDEFVLMAKARPISGKIKRQQHARRFHSYFFVFRKDS